jgi:cell shape-determining protein MreD
LQARQATAASKDQTASPHSAYLMSSEQQSEQNKVYQKVMAMFLGYAAFAFFCYNLFDFSIYNDILRDFVMGGILGLDVLTFIYYIYHHVQNQRQWNRDKKLLIAGTCTLSTD